MNTMIIQIIIDIKILLISWTKSDISFGLRIVKMIGHKQMYIIPMKAIMLDLKTMIIFFKVFGIKKKRYMLNLMQPNSKRGERTPAQKKDGGRSSLTDARL